MNIYISKYVLHQFNISQTTGGVLKLNELKSKNIATADRRGV